MKRFICLTLALMLACTCILTLSSCGNKSGDKVIKIGVYEPASGSNGPGGKQETLGVIYAHSIQNTIEIGGETYKIELVEVDNQSDNAKGITAASELVNKGVSVVLGSYGSGVSIAASPTFEEAGVAAIGITCTNTQVTAGNKHYFRICFLDDFQGAVLAKKAWDDGAKVAYTLAEAGNPYDLGLTSSFKTAFEKLGGKVIAENFTTGTADFTSFVTNAVKGEADVMFAPTSIEYAQLIIKAVSAQGANIPLLAGDTWDSNVILNAAKGTNVSIEVTTFYQEGANTEFDSGFKAWLNAAGNEKYLTANGGNDIISAVSAMGYDAYFTALEAIKAAGSADRAAIKQALWGVEFKGVTGNIKFEQVNGDADRNIAYIKKANNTTGLWEFVKEQGIG
ncbi:MAG: ABC transporter substrate-binding protein [Eubacteriales bacterium]|nr:ABC transporter substrate-binding protein [Eubacteriales bacterium]MDY4898211.1 ABC transporter substrate-binding protein [Eubacteriales bacterium]